VATLKELAALVAGRVVGDPEVEIHKLAPIDQAGVGDITFLANPKLLPLLAGIQASAVIIAPGVEAPEHLNRLLCENPYLAFAKILTFLHVRRPAPQGLLPGCTVHPSAQLDAEVTIHPGCVVGAKVRIGRGTILYPNVVLYDGVTIGADCTLHAGVVVREGCVLGERVIVQPSAVIGSDGFGFAPDGETYFKIPQIGIVVIEDDVEIGACTCIDRAALGVTRIGEGVKLDNLVQIAHNVSVGPHTVMAAQAGIAGSTKIGRHCTFGGQSATAGHIKVGDNLTVGGRGGLTGSIEGNQVVSGAPAIPHKDWIKASLVFPRLPEMRKDLIRLQKELEQLKHQLKEEK
jgi:UDP-3-O-[3-hydroxymyristoyl] glucosamine N-acyltransferase